MRNAHGNKKHYHPTFIEDDTEEQSSFLELKIMGDVEKMKDDKGDRSSNNGYMHIHAPLSQTTSGESESSYSFSSTPNITNKKQQQYGENTCRNTMEHCNGIDKMEETEPENNKDEGRKCCRYGPAFWCRKYFWEGQHLKDNVKSDGLEMIETTPRISTIIARHRRLVAFIIPALLFHFGWWAVVIRKELFYYFREKYFMSITMIFGSMIAGMTSEGGGAVAFPVMTLAFKIHPSIARDFSMMIQSCGMSAAAFSILFMRVHIEWAALILGSLGGGVGLIFGLHLVDPNLTPPQKKMAFVSVFFAFASVLCFLNRYHKRPTFNNILALNWWRGLVVFITGFVGGIFTSFSGSGLDIMTFSILTLLFRISEKVATPTSVILMAGNSLVGFFWRGLIMGDISQEAWEYLAVCIPIVVIGAPVGSVIGSHFHRLVLAALVIILDVVSLIGAYAVIRPLTPQLIGMSVGIIVCGVVFFAAIAYAGHRLVMHLQEKGHLSAENGKPSQNSRMKWKL